MKDDGSTDMAEVTFTINGVGGNTALVAVADMAMASEAGPAISVDVLAHDTDVDPGDDPTTFSLDMINSVVISGIGAVDLATGTVSIVDDEILFDPGTDFNELDVGDTATVTVNYTMSDDEAAPPAPIS